MAYLSLVSSEETLGLAAYIISLSLQLHLFTFSLLMIVHSGSDPFLGEISTPVARRRIAPLLGRDIDPDSMEEACPTSIHQGDLKEACSGLIRPRIARRRLTRARMWPWAAPRRLACSIQVDEAAVGLVISISLLYPSSLNLCIHVVGRATSDGSHGACV
jgi:hypothetical protein